MNILVVEDNVDINNLICRILQNEGDFVRGAYSGSEGIMCIEQFEYDLLILDLMLPGVTGEEIIEKVRENITNFYDLSRLNSKDYVFDLKFIN